MGRGRMSLELEAGPSDWQCHRVRSRVGCRIRRSVNRRESAGDRGGKLARPARHAMMNLSSETGGITDRTVTESVAVSRSDHVCRPAAAACGTSSRALKALKPAAVPGPVRLPGRGAPGRGCRRAAPQRGRH
eukprot:754286-Hanusia_phi.AAC.6